MTICKQNNICWLDTIFCIAFVMKNRITVCNANGHRDGWMDEWMDGWMDGWMDRTSVCIGRVCLVTVLDIRKSWPVPVWLDIIVNDLFAMCD